MKIYIVQLATMGEEALKGRLLRTTVKKVKLALETAINKVDADIAATDESIVEREAKISRGDLSQISALVKDKLDNDERTKEREVLVEIKAKFYSKGAKAEAEKDYDGEEDAE